VGIKSRSITDSSDSPKPCSDTSALTYGIGIEFEEAIDIKCMRAARGRLPHFFSSACQLTTSVIGTDASNSSVVFTRNRCPLGEVS